MNKRIREVRDFYKLTQEDFGKKIGSARNTIANYENGNRTPSNSVIISICREFNVNEDWLRTGNGKMLIEIDKENQLMAWAGSVLGSSDESFKKRFVKMLSELDESDWETLEKIATKLHKNG